MKPIRTGAVFVGCAALGSVMLPVSGALGFLGFVPALVLPLPAFMVAGGLAGATVDKELSNGVLPLACAFATVGISALTFGLMTHFADASIVFLGGGGAFLVGFGLAGVFAGVGCVSWKLRAGLVLAFELGGVLGASAAVAVRLLAYWSSLNSAAVGAIVGLGAAGVIMAWVVGRWTRPRLDAA